MMGRSVALLALLGVEVHHVHGFSLNLPRQAPRRFAVTATADDTVDLSIPYDSAARLAYDEWRVEYNKGGFDPERYESFKKNYEAITVANVKAKKAARESGTNAPKLMAMNEFGDYTAEEYTAMQQESGGTGDVLGKAVEAAESQAAAASALGDAAEAVAKEEEKLAEKLGYDSVEELETAMDKMQGIAEDGGELPDNLAREARVRSAYLDWCKQFGKEPDETRYPTFESNFLAMEQYAEESGKAMNLNQYADYTEEEYEAVSGKTSTVTAPATPKVDKPSEEAAAKKQAAAEAKKKEEQKAKAKAAADARAKAEAASKMSAEERKAANEKERKERQAAQDKAAEKLRLDNEATAISATKAAAEAEAAQIAKRRAMEQKAAELSRKQAAEAEAKQRKLIESRLAKMAPPKTKKSPTSMFMSVLGKNENPDAQIKKRVEGKLKEIKSAAEAAKKAKASSYARSAAANKKKDAPKRGSFDLSSVFEGPTKKSPKRKAPAPVQPKAKASRVPVTKSAPQKGTATGAFASLFKSSPAPAPKEAPKTTPIVKKAPSTFFSFGSPAPKATPKVTSKPATVTKKAPAPFFSFGAATPKTTPAPTPTPVAKKSPSFFSFGTAAKAAPSTGTKVIKKGPPAAKRPPVSAPRPSLPIFGGTPKPKQPPAPTATKVIKKKQPWFGSPAKKVAPAPGPTPAPVAKKQPFSLFGGGASAPSKRAVGRGTLSIPKPKDEAEAKKGGWNFFGGGSTAASTAASKPKDDTPVLARFVQNEDGSLTGFISNSKSFRNGTKITTSPVRRGAKAGQVVKTGSGSKYRLE